MCTSGINHTSNGYYYAFMDMGTILFLSLGSDEPTEAYNISLEAANSTAEMENCNATNHRELNKSYVYVDDEYNTNRFQEMFFIMSSELDQYSGIWNELNNITLMGTSNYPKTTTAAYAILCCCRKPKAPRQVHAPPVAFMFIQSGNTDKNKKVPGNYGISFPEVTCYCYQETGHYAGNFPSSIANTCTGS